MTSTKKNLNKDKMIQANEFRIGNLLIEKNSGQIIEVINISQKHISFSGQFKAVWKAEPIPLTEKWFENFGAKRDDLEIDSYILSSFTCDYRFFKSTTIDGDIYWTCEKVLGDTSIEYVNQLQNLYFALTGEELKLNDK